MNQRQTPSPNDPNPRGVALPAPSGTETLGVLIVSTDLSERTRWVHRAESWAGWRPAEADSPERAFSLASLGGVCVAMVSAHDQSGYELVGALRRVGVGAVMMSSSPNLDQAVHAMQAGALDLIDESLSNSLVYERLSRAVQRHNDARQSSERIERLQRACRTLNAARHEVTEQVGSMCDDLVHAYAQITRQIEDVRLASEFEVTIRQELDLEDLLRTVLEFLLAKIGSTNAAMYLPSSSGEYSLGAYVNYDCPKESAELLMDHLADVVPARLEHRSGVIALNSEEELMQAFGENGSWLSDYGVVAFPALDEAGECLAVTLLFRDRRTPFDAKTAAMLETLAPLFAAQLARVVRVHHRHTGGYGGLMGLVGMDSEEDFSEDDWESEILDEAGGADGYPFGQIDGEEPTEDCGDDFGLAA